MGATGQGGLTLFRFRGIRVSVDYSWFFVLFLVIWWLSGFYKDVLGPGTSDLLPYALALASALLFFASILLHEFGHALVAIRNGIGIDGITLWLFGGVARMERDTDSPGVEFRVAVAGPLVTLAIAFICTAIGVALTGPEEFRRAALTEGTTAIGALPALLGWLASINILVLVFNLVPAFPLDGGRIARAIAWKKTGNRASATRFAARLGQIFAYLLMALGLLSLINGNVVGGIWLGVLGFILNNSAKAAVAQSKVASKVEGISVADLMDPGPPVIPASASLSTALDDFFAPYGWPWFAVTDPNGRFLGLLAEETILGIPPDQRTTEIVADHMAADETQAHIAIKAEAPLEDALDREELPRLGGLMAVDGSGRVVGLLTAQAVQRSMGADGPWSTA
jgi:Zn-dependent protease/CBS domain-containing protein